MHQKNRRPLQIGMALGGGSARGWAHIGIIHALEEIGIKPEIVCGCSIGSLVGASYAAGNLKKLESWVRSLTTRTVVSFLELDFSFKGFVDAERLQTFLNQNVCDEKMQFADLSKQFATVSTDLETGREIWFTQGSVLNAVWASISLPGLFPPIQSQGRWLVDGGLVNPVPVSVCHALGADIVIAVNLNGDIVGKHFTHKRHDSAITQAIKTFSNSLFTKTKSKERPPGLFDTIAGSFNITQDRITRSRMAGEPPDIILSPKLSHIGLLEFDRAVEAIEEGRACVSRMLPEIKHVTGWIESK